MIFAIGINTFRKLNRNGVPIPTSPYQSNNYYLSYITTSHTTTTPTIHWYNIFICEVKHRKNFFLGLTASFLSATKWTI